MTTRSEAVRVGLRRPALQGALALMFVGGLVLVAASAQGRRSVGAWIARDQEPGQDTVQVNRLLGKVRGVDPAICQLVGRSLDNRFGGFSYMVHGWESPSEEEDELLEWVSSAPVAATVVSALRRGLGDPDACVRRTAAHLLGRARVTDLSEQLRAELASSSATTREAAVRALGYFDQVTGLDAARAALRDPDLSVRVAAAWALGMIESEDAIPALSQAAGASDARLRRTIAWALGSIEDVRGLDALNTLLRDADAGVRIQAAHAMGQIESQEAIPALVRLLETDQDARVRRAAAAALGQING